MKRTLSLCLLLATVLFGFKAAAYTVTVKWDNPGAVKIKTGSLGAEFESIPDGATEHSVEITGTFGYVYIYPGDDFNILSVTQPNNLGNLATYATYYSLNCNSSNRTKWGDPGVFTVTTKKIERNSSFTVNVVNGAETITGTFNSDGYTIPQLVNGKNTVKYDPDIDKDFRLTSSVGKMYSVKINGTEFVPTEFYGSYRYWDMPIVPDCTMDIQVTEADYKDAVLSFNVPDALKDCVKNIRNWSASTFIEDFKFEPISVSPGTDLQFNFNEDYTFTKFMLGDKDITSSFTGSSIRFNVDEDATLTIEGTAKVYKQLSFNVTILNPEGVKLIPNIFSGAATELGEGTPLSADVTKGGITFTTASSKSYTVQASEKTPYIYIAPADGWYIRNVMNNSGEGLSRIETAEGTAFFVAAQKYVKDAKFDVNITGTKLSTRLTENETYSMQWSNPAGISNMACPEGKTTVDYVSGYSNPFKFRYLAASDADLTGVYLDGLKLSPDDDGIYNVDPFFPESPLTPQLQVYASGTTGGQSYLFTVTCEDGLSATATYSDLARPVTSLTSDQNIFLKGTKITLKPSTADCIIKVGSKIVHGINTDGVYVNALNADGVYEFAISGSSKVTISKQTTFDIAASKPAAGATVKSLGTVELYLAPFEGSENMPYPSMETMAAVTIAKDGAEPMGLTELGEPSMTDDGQYFIFPIIFDQITQAGEYTLSIPAGAFIESAYDDVEEATLGVKGGAISAAYTAKFTIDPNMVGKLDNYKLLPASGTAIKALDKLFITFTDRQATDMVQTDYTKSVTMTCGSKTVDTWVSLNGAGNEFVISFLNSDSDDAPLTEEGIWTLDIPKGYFTFDGDLCPAISAQYTIGADLPAYALAPAAGSAASSLAKITIFFPGTDSNSFAAEDNESTITLKGTGFSSSAIQVTGKENGGEYVMWFSPAPSVAGEYTLNIPAGSFSVNAKSSEAVTATFTYEPNWKLTPAPGSEVKSFDNITLEFPKANEATFSGERFCINLSNGGAYATSNFSVEAVEGADHPTFNIALSSEAQLPPSGYIQLIIDEGAFTIDGVDSEEIKATYLSAPEVSLEYTIDPANGYIVDYGWGAMWSFIFAENATVSSVDESKFKVTLDGKDVQFMTMAENNYLMMGLYESAYGELVVSAPAGACMVGGESAPALNGKWTIVPNKTYSSHIEAEGAVGDKVHNLSSIIISFPDAETASYDPDYRIELAESGYGSDRYIEVGVVTEITTATPAATDASAEPTFRVTFPSITKTTSYTLTVPEGAFVLDGIYASEYMRESFSGLVGVQAVEVADAAQITVITLDGKVIFKDATPEDFKTLPAGFYIIGGKKTFIK